MIPFPIKIPSKRQDGNLLEKLKEEASGILNWLLEDCREWRVQGLGAPPPAVKRATDSYRADQDETSLFFDNCCAFHNGSEKYFAYTSELRRAYEQFCDTAGLTALSSQAVAERLRENGCKDGKKQGKRVWYGVSLTTDNSAVGHKESNSSLLNRN